MSEVLLRGQEYVTLGAVGEGGGDEVAAAITRGGAPKPYQHIDPNEDAALAMRGACGALVAVADGHYGCCGAETALESLLAAAREWLVGSSRSPDAWYQAALAALIAANDAVLAGQDARMRARTTLSFALARPEDDLLVHGALGDSHLFVVDAIVAAEIPRPRKTLFLGAGELAPSAAERHGRIGVQTLDLPRAIVAATDGLSERAIGVADPAGAVHAAVTAAAAEPAGVRAAAAARGIVDAA
ncbi:MAG TPA: protein phosphatase 2C domain-containing protein, partial [Myxococcota bacterium]|nr:protein phosphatase 2C domain-containing protein [Myxococcota bacterium]